MMDGAVGAFASATFCTSVRSDCSSAMSAARFSLRVATAPLARARAAVSAVCRSVMAAWTVESAGIGDGNDGLFVIPVTMPCAYVMRAGTFVGSLRLTPARWGLVELLLLVVMVLMMILLWIEKRVDERVF